MNEYSASAKPSKLVPVMIGGAAMAVISNFPVINLINCACCAGVMGAAVLGVWFYKKSFPEDMSFTVGDGAAIGALSGIIGAVISTIIQVVSIGVLSPDFAVNFQDEFDQALSQAETQAADPAAIDMIREGFTTLAGTPILLALLMLLAAMVVFVGFGALGGVIGGNIFKTKVLPPQQMPPMQNNPGL